MVLIPQLFLRRICDPTESRKLYKVGEEQEDDFNAEDLIRGGVPAAQIMRQ